MNLENKVNKAFNEIENTVNKASFETWKQS